MHTTAPSSPPTALREPAPRRTFAWLLPVVALALSGFLLSQGFKGRGPLILVNAVNGHGIREGDSLRHLGIAVGEVEAVRLGSTLDHVELAIRLAPESSGIAREGSRFWIVRPHLALDSISGLETIIGSRYVAVVPGPAGAERRAEFAALVDPPLDEALEPGGVEVVLEAPARFGLRAGAPVEYREVRVGTVLAVGLASDASSVEARAYIRPQYVELVREGTRFWESGGFEMELGLTSGLKVGLESLQSMLVGGVRFATPPNGGAVARTGHRFALAEEPAAEWLTWRPNVPVGSTMLAPGSVLPQVSRARLVWREGRILKRKKERHGCVVWTPQGIVGPRDLLQVPEDALDARAGLELDGTEVPLVEGSYAEPLGAYLARVSVERAGPATVFAPRALGEDEDVILVRESGIEPLAIDAARLNLVTSEEGTEGGGEGSPAPPSPRVYEVHADVGLDAGWHGAIALGRGDGAPVGVLLVEKRSARLVPFP